MKIYKFFNGVITGLLAIIYLMFIIVVSAMFKIFPWHDPDGGYMLRLLVLWLPMCFVTIIQIVLSLIAKRFNKPLVTLVSLNAIYIPMIFLLGFVNISLIALKLICILATVTMIIYTVLAFGRLKKIKLKKNGEKNV
ncbi:MAG: hypothetical protein IJA55_01520 [Clostridia bacterium]|nr:hypothetical protein [Clostridia bacterium]